MEINNDLAALELQVEVLLKRYQELSNENALLRTKLAKSLQEKAILFHKVQKTILAIKQIIGQIKGEIP